MVWTAGYTIFSAIAVQELILGYINIRNVCFPISRGVQCWCIIEAEMPALVFHVKTGLSVYCKAGLELLVGQDSAFL